MSSERLAAARAALLATPWSRAPLAFVDLEMTGLDPKADRIIEICIERCDPDAPERRLCTLVNPERPLGDVVRRIVTISAASLGGAPRWSQIAAEVTSLLDGALMVAHAARHDLAFLNAELTRAGVPWRRPLYLDTLSLARRRLQLPGYGLAALAQHFGVDNPRPHRAGNDVAVLRALLPPLLQAARAPAGEAAPADGCGDRVRDVLALARAGVDVAAVMQAARKALGSGRAATLRYRARGKPPEQLSFCTTAVRADLDPPRVLGYLLPSRGRRELWADRILSFELHET